MAKMMRNRIILEGLDGCRLQKYWVREHHTVSNHEKAAHEHEQDRNKGDMLDVVVAYLDTGLNDKCNQDQEAE